MLLKCGKFKSENLPKFITNISNLLDQQVIGTLRNEVAKKNSLIKEDQSRHLLKKEFV